MQKETALHRFEHVLENGADACLPRNLSDYWLETLSRQAEDMLDGSSDSPKATELTAAIIHILQAKIETATEIQVKWSNYPGHPVKGINYPNEVDNESAETRRETIQKAV